MRVLFVCSGNTCRSAMAAVIARRVAAERGLADVRAESAGTDAAPGMPASDGALLIALEHGDDLATHRARPATAALVAGSDLILAMGPQHLARLQALGAGERAHLLTAYASSGTRHEPVEDPFGSDLEAYRHTFQALEHLIHLVFDRLALERARARS